MKLNQAQISRTLAQFPALVLADNHPAVAQFSERFGHHTFFFDNSGLNVLELIQVPGAEAQDGEVIRLADWTNEDCSSLTTHQPEPTGLVICLRASSFA
jgi:hypothetical protein